MLSITTGQFVICISDGHIAIELNDTSECEQSCDNPIEEQNASSADNTKNCSNCIDTIVTRNEIIKSKDDISSSSKYNIRNLIKYQTDEISNTKIVSSFFYLQNYKSLIHSYDQYNIDASILLI
jgi:hypothetical protein